VRASRAETREAQAVRGLAWSHKACASGGVCLVGERGGTMGFPKSYRSIEEFEREELRPGNKVGFSLEDLVQETMMGQSDLLFDDTVDEYDPDQKDDDKY
jgi:hypothetical protein